MLLRTHYVDITQRKTFPAEITIQDQKIVRIIPTDLPVEGYMIPGFVDAHVHVESSMLVPSEFARLAVRHGTVATVSDPHEIANVLGTEGVQYMVNNGKQTPFKFYFGVPSCVPATTFETAGATLDAEAVEALLQQPDLYYLAEVMNYPGVLHQDPELWAKINAAKAVGKPIDGHAPALRGVAAQEYAQAGISTDHECTTLEEALEKLTYGMHILIREGSAAKNFEALIGLLPAHTNQVMFCSDDKHPDELLQGHINQLVIRALKHGVSIYDALQVACINPVRHYGLEVGCLQVGDWADFVLVNDLEQLEVLETYINGTCVARQGKDLLTQVPISTPNQFHCSPKTATDFAIPAQGQQHLVIQALDGELITQSAVVPATIHHGQAIANPSTDVLKIAVVNRYQDAPPAVAFIRGIGLKKGALASCVAHDSHNIVAVGCTDEALSQAVNLIIEHKGGIAAISEDERQVLPLPVAGILSADTGETVAAAYAQIDRFAKQALGTPLSAPFMTLSFMALLVIPSLKLSDKGLFDGVNFKWASMWVDE